MSLKINNIDQEIAELHEETDFWHSFENDIDNLFEDMRSKYHGGYLELAVKGINERLNKLKEQNKSL